METTLPAAGTTTRIAGLGLPVIDMIAPTPEELDAGEALIVQAGLTVDHRLPEARAALAELQKFVEDHQFNVAGAKTDLSQEQAQTLSTLFSTLIEGARAINEAAEKLDKPRLDIRHLGGSMVNKFHAIKAAMGEQVDAHILGALGKEDTVGNRERTLKKLATSQLNFTEMEGVSLGNIAVNYILPTSDHDRIVLKAPLTHLSQEISEHIPEIRQFTHPDKVDVYFTEGSDIGSRKFGYPAFKAGFKSFTQSDHKSENPEPERPQDTGKLMVFSAPTDTKLILGNDPEAVHNRDRLTQTIFRPETRFISCNETEGVALFLNQKLDTTSSPTLEHNPQVFKLLKHLQPTLKKKEAFMEGGLEPVVFLSIGPEGAFAVTSEHMLFSPAPKVKAVVNTLGAGDSFFAGTFTNYMAQRSDPARFETRDGLQRFSTAQLQEMLDTGQTLAFHTVQQKGAQLPREKIPAMLEGTPPYEGVITGIDLDKSQTRGRA